MQMYAIHAEMTPTLFAVEKGGDGRGN